MTDRDWRIFREDFEIYIKVGCASADSGFVREEQLRFCLEFGNISQDEVAVFFASICLCRVDECLPQSEHGLKQTCRGS